MSMAGRFDEAEEFLRRGLKQSHPDESHVRKVYALLVYTQMQLGRPQDAMATCRKGRVLFPRMRSYDSARDALA